jgi:hypothetical protein
MLYLSLSHPLNTLETLSSLLIYTVNLSLLYVKLLFRVIICKLKTWKILEAKNSCVLLHTVHSQEHFKAFWMECAICKSLYCIYSTRCKSQFLTTVWIHSLKWMCHEKWIFTLYFTLCMSADGFHNIWLYFCKIKVSACLQWNHLLIPNVLPVAIWRAGRFKMNLSQLSALSGVAVPTRGRKST